MNDVPRPEYPRPQFRRPEWTNLNGRWSFAFDDADEGISGGWHEVAPGEMFAAEIKVPFCHQSEESGIGDPGFHDVVWYARTFDAPSLDPDERLLLHFGAVDYRATVWVNGTRVAFHEGGHTPFSADVTDALGGENVVVVRAEDPARDVTVPRGKQYWEERSAGIFYTRTTGIWQTVWLEKVGRRHVCELHITPDVDSVSAFVEVGMEGFEAGMSLRFVVEFEGETVVRDTTEVFAPSVERRLQIGNPAEPPPTPHLSDWRGANLWSPEHPNLYDLRVELLDPDGNVLDSVESYFGMRKVEVKEGRVYLNDRPLYQRLVLDQGYFPGGLLTAPTDDDLKRDIELAKEMGFNGARKHQKVEDPRWLYHADRLGFLVWGEMANAYEYSRDYVRRITSEWQEVMARDHNHPCIITWVPVNESWGVPGLLSDPDQVQHLLAMYHLTRSLDRSRPVISNDGWEHATTDILAIHDYRDAASMSESYASVESTLATRPAKRPLYVPGHAYRGEPILITEFGGIAFDSDPDGWGYSTVSSPEKFLESYGAQVRALLASEPVQGFCYTQLTDVEQEKNGLLTFDRKPKADLDEIRHITSA